MNGLAERMIGILKKTLVRTLENRPLLRLLGMCINSIKGENKLNNNITKLADFSPSGLEDLLVSTEAPPEWRPKDEIM